MVTGSCYTPPGKTKYLSTHILNFTKLKMHPRVYLLRTSLLIFREDFEILHILSLDNIKSV